METTQYTLKRSRRRRTLGLQVALDGAVRVSAPYFTPRFWIDRFVRKNWDWVIRQQTKFADRRAQTPPWAIQIQTAPRAAHQKTTEEKLTPLIERYASLLGVRPSSVKVVEQKRRWGSCSRQCRLRFNWRLSLLPPEAMEYVVVHELAHLKEHNHSRHFWAVIASVLPDYKSRRLLLRGKQAIIPA